MSKKRAREILQACLLGDVAALGHLLPNTDPDAVTIDDRGDTLLAFAIRRGNLEMVRVLVEHGARLDRANAAGETPAELVARSTDRGLRAYFDVRGTDLPVDVSVRLFEVLDRIVEGTATLARLQALLALALADPCARRAGTTPLLVLARGHVADVAFYDALLAAGAELDTVDGAGASELHHAAAGGLADLAGWLLAHGALIDRPDAAGWTPLHHAARSRAPGAYAVAQLLLAHGASAMQLDSDGLGPDVGASPRIAAIIAETPGASRRGDLERDLRASFTRDHLAIYADQLLHEDDPRGELIALDLAPRPTSGTWRARRHELCIDWLGDSRDLHEFERLVRFGFVLHLDDDAGTVGRRPGRSRIAAALLQTPAADQLRSFAVWGVPERVTASLRTLTETRRPWLAELLIGQRDRRLAPKLVDAIIAATPHLETLYLLGDGELEAFAHPHVRRVIVANERTIRTPPRGLHVLARGRPIPPAHLADVVEAIAAIESREQLLADYADLVPELPAILTALERDGVTRFDDGERADGPLTALGRAMLGKHLQLSLCY